MIITSGLARIALFIGGCFVLMYSETRLTRASTLMGGMVLLHATVVVAIGALLMLIAALGRLPW